ncbi:hypothetical protein Tco_0448778 [Tanacetum coccineum]
MYTRYGGALSIAGTGISSISLRESGRRRAQLTRRYPSSTTIFLTHTVNGVFLNPEDKALYYDNVEAQGLGSRHRDGCALHRDEYMSIGSLGQLVRDNISRGLEGIGQTAHDHSIPPPCTHVLLMSPNLNKERKRLTRQVNMFMKLFRSDDKFSQMLTQLESHPEYGDGSGSGGCGDDEPGDYEDIGEDGEDEDDS